MQLRPEHLLQSQLVVAGSLVMEEAMLAEKEQVLSLEIFLQMVAEEAGIIITWVLLADQALEALKEVLRQ
jgi:hypothetical protein